MWNKKFHFSLGNPSVLQGTATGQGSGRPDAERGLGAWRSAGRVPDRCMGTSHPGPVWESRMSCTRLQSWGPRASAGP